MFSHALFTLLLALTPAVEKLRVVATIPELADMVREIGGDRVDVTSISRGRENLHTVATRPSHLVAMSRADLFVQVGLSLEMAFVPALLSGSGNRKIQPGKPGFCNVSEGWTALDVPAQVDRRFGDVHPQGNPHMNLDPRAGKLMAQRIFEALVRVDPGSEAYFKQRYDAYLKQLDAAFERWSAIGKSFDGKKVVVYHQEYNYLAQCWGIIIVGTIEVRPGIPPTPNHLAELIGAMKKQDCKTILTAIWSNGSDVERVAEQTGARIVELPNQCGGIEGTDTWIGMMDLIMKRLAGALDAAPSLK